MAKTTRPIPPQTTPNRSPDTPQEGRNRPRRVNPPRHPSGLGIDLERYHEDVKRILISKHAATIRRLGLDRDEVLSELYRRIHQANLGRAAYNPARASMSRYIMVQCYSTIANLVQARDNRAKHEVLGALDRSGNPCDAAQVDHEAPNDELRRAALELGRDDDERLGLYLVAMGADDAEVLEACSHSPRVLRLLADRGPEAL